MKLHLEHHIDENWSLCDAATDSWLGILCNEDGDEVVDLQELCVVDFARARRAAEKFCEAWNSSEEGR